MASITTRAGKGSPLTNAELDANFSNLNTALDGKSDTTHNHTGLYDLAGTAAAAVATHADNTNNPHSVTKAQVGLGNVDNTSDANKPISSAAAAALATKLELGGTYSSATPNGVVYANGSKVLTTGSALTFDGELLSAPRVSSKQGIFTNANTITTNQTIAATDNAGSYGPMSINSGVVVTVSSGAVWTII